MFSDEITKYDMARQKVYIEKGETADCGDEKKYHSVTGGTENHVTLLQN
jgi:hypothetical protein